MENWLHISPLHCACILHSPLSILKCTMYNFGCCAIRTGLIQWHWLRLPSTMYILYFTLCTMYNVGCCAIRIQWHWLRLPQLSQCIQLPISVLMQSTQQCRRLPGSSWHQLRAVFGFRLLLIFIPDLLKNAQGHGHSNA